MWFDLISVYLLVNVIDRQNWAERGKVVIQVVKEENCFRWHNDSWAALGWGGTTSTLTILNDVLRCRNFSFNLLAINRGCCQFCCGITERFKTVLRLERPVAALFAWLSWARICQLLCSVFVGERRLVQSVFDLIVNSIKRDNNDLVSKSSIHIPKRRSTEISRSNRINQSNQEFHSTFSKCSDLYEMRFAMDWSRYNRFRNENELTHWNRSYRCLRPQRRGLCAR